LSTAKRKSCGKRKSESGLEASIRRRWVWQGQEVGFPKYMADDSIEMERIRKPNYAIAQPTDLRKILTVCRFIAMR